MKIKKEIIVTERLLIKPYSEQDLDSLVELLMNEQISKTFMIPLYETREQYVELAQKLIDFSSPEDEKHLEYGIYLNGNAIGFVNDCGFNDEAIEIGYVINPEYQGQGYATEAVQAVINQLWTMGFKKIIAGFFEENIASFRVMEKCGMTLNGESDYEEYRGVNLKCIYCEIVK